MAMEQTHPIVPEAEEVNAIMTTMIRRAGGNS